MGLDLCGILNVRLRRGHPPCWVGWVQDKAGPLGVLLSLDVLISS